MLPQLLMTLQVEWLIEAWLRKQREGAVEDLLSQLNMMILLRWPNICRIIRGETNDGEQRWSFIIPSTTLLMETNKWAGNQTQILNLWPGQCLSCLNANICSEARWEFLGSDMRLYKCLLIQRQWDEELFMRCKTMLLYVWTESLKRQIVCVFEVGDQSKWNTSFFACWCVCVGGWVFSCVCAWVDA